MDRGYTTNGLNQYTKAGPANFTYDANGNLTGDGWITFTYDIENRLVEASGSKSLTLTYDPLGRLWETDPGTGTDPVTRFLYDGDALVAEYDYQNNLQHRYVHGNGVDNPLLWYDGSTVSEATRRHLYANWQGSIAGITDGKGELIAVNAYDAYGIPNPTNVGRFQYTGQIYLPELGIYHYKARAYSATLGRFLQTDPIGYEDQYNLYAYVGGDPVNMLDPTGMISSSWYEDMKKKAADAAQKASEMAESAKEGVSNALDNADALEDTPRNIRDDLVTEAVPDSIYQTDREKQGIDGDYKLYPDYPNLPAVKKAVNTEIIHAIDRGVERKVFGNRAEAQDAFGGLKKQIKASGWPGGTVYDRDGRGAIRANSVLVPIGNNGYAVYRVNSRGTASLQNTLIKRD